MTNAEALIYCIGVTLISGFLIHRLVYGDNAVGAPAEALEQAKKRWEVAGNLVRTFFSVVGVVKFASHVGWLVPAWKAALFPVVGIPFVLSIAVCLKARWDVKRASVAH